MKKIIKSIIYKFIRMSRKCIYFFLKFLPIKQNKIIFDSYAGKGYGDNPGYIADEIIRQGLNYDLVWVVRDLKENFPPEIRVVKYGSLKSAYEFATAKVWIDNLRNAIRPKKRNNQIYLQTWHAAYGFKKVEKDAVNLLPSYIKRAMQDGQETDAIIAASERQYRLYKKSFWLNQNTEILKFGAPRYDKLINQAKDTTLITNIKSELGISKDTYTVLYAPTFRDDMSTKWYITDLNKIAKTFEKKYDKKCVVIVRLHPNVTSHKTLFNYSSEIINGSDYPGMQNLSLAADCMITDYSSSIFDFILLEKDVFIYAPDYENYKSFRGLNDEFDNCPYPKAYSLNELIDNINSFDEEVRNIINKYYQDNPVYKTGNSSKLTVEWIKQKISQ